MKKQVCFVLTCLLMGAILSACSPSQAEQDAQATKIAAELSANQTAEAPTSTPTHTPTHTPTSTPTSTPASKPTRTPTPITLPSLPAGWREHSTSGFHIALPDHWEAMEIGEEGTEAILDLLEGMDTEWARNIAPMFSENAMQGMIKFWAMDSEPAGIGHATVAVAYQTQPVPIPVEVLCAFMPSVSTQMGFEVVDTECGLNINDLDAARFVTSLQMGAVPFKQYLYTYVREGNVWTVSLTVDETEWPQYEPIFAAIAESFRVD